MASETHLYQAQVLKALKRLHERFPDDAYFSPEEVRIEAGVSVGTAIAYLKRCVRDGQCFSIKDKHDSYISKYGARGNDRV